MRFRLHGIEKDDRFMLYDLIESGLDPVRQDFFRLLYGSWRRRAHDLVAYGYIDGPIVQRGLAPNLPLFMVHAFKHLDMITTMNNGGFTAERLFPRGNLLKR